ncbi:hypothetical protein SAMN05192533_102271 [Mesobacillus persicus]|uniref:Uncharacterized protein n=1 Tax=Mesobacillus persicus TaxID=930146 RepID=A0A1H7XPA6_9BACI|nr:hypothetical protein [Mesobacillus persicus]SEM34819.1 hypothetical protein SAMN05192533_102271 [Mesobacillus persicus]
MNHPLIKTSLESLQVPVEFITYDGEETTYITYSQYDAREALASDDEEQATNLFFQVNVFSKGDYIPLVEQIKQKMREIGGIRVNESPDMYVDEYYQKSIRFKFTKFND